MTVRGPRCGGPYFPVNAGVTCCDFLRMKDQRPMPSMASTSPLLPVEAPLQYLTARCRDCGTEKQEILFFGGVAVRSPTRGSWKPGTRRQTLARLIQGEHSA